MAITSQSSPSCRRSLFTRLLTDEVQLEHDDGTLGARELALDGVGRREGEEVDVLSAVGRPERQLFRVVAFLGFFARSPLFPPLGLLVAFELDELVKDVLLSPTLSVPVSVTFTAERALPSRSIANRSSSGRSGSGVSPRRTLIEVAGTRVDGSSRLCDGGKSGTFSSGGGPDSMLRNRNDKRCAKILPSRIIKSAVWPRRSLPRRSLFEVSGTGIAPVDGSSSLRDVGKLSDPSLDADVQIAF